MKKNSLYGWQKEALTYFDNGIPSPKAWFEFVGWIISLATLNFLYEKTHSIYLYIIFSISLIVFYNHFAKIFWTKQFQKYLPARLAEPYRKFVTYAVSVLCIAVSYSLIGSLSNDIAKVLKF